MLYEHTAHRLAIVTGASRRRGIGAAVCRALAQAGVDIFFMHWSPYDRRMPWGAEEDEPAYVLTLAVEVAPRGITVNAVDPGPTDTGWMTEEVKRELLPRYTGTIGVAECIDGPVCSSLDSSASRSAARHPPLRHPSRRRSSLGRSAHTLASRGCNASLAMFIRP